MLDCNGCHWENTETCRVCKQEEPILHIIDWQDAVKEASEKGNITIYSAFRLDGLTFKQILDKINGRVNR